MKKFCWGMVAAWLPLMLHAAEPITMAGKITDVTVYPDRAQVTRTVEVNLPAGESRVVLPQLPVSLQDDSVRATDSGRAGMVIQDVEVRQIVGEKIFDEETARLEQRLRALRDDRAALDGRQRVLDQQATVLQQIQVKATGDLSREIQVNKFDLEQLRKLPAFVAEQALQLENDRRKLEVERRELDHAIRATEAEFNKRRAAASRATKSVVVTVSTPAAAPARLQVSYVVPDASWSPVYDARAVTERGQVEFTYGAMVRQRTGEDWIGVNLTLFTARPAIGVSLPELGKWVMNFFEPQPVVGVVPAQRFSLARSSTVASSELREQYKAEVAGEAQAEMLVQTATGGAGDDGDGVPRAARGGCAGRWRGSPADASGDELAGDVQLRNDAQTDALYVSESGNDQRDRRAVSSGPGAGICGR